MGPHRCDENAHGGLIRIAREGAAVLGSGEDVARAAADLAAHHWVRLPGLFASDLMDEVDRGIAEGELLTREHGEVGAELCLRPCELTERLTVLMNAPQVLRFAEAVGATGHLGCFEGRIYRVVPGRGHHDGWHTDKVAARMLALSVNLGGRPYQGGTLLLRRSGASDAFDEVENLGRGDGILFRLSYELEHRIADMRGDVAKTAWAGWFRARPEHADVVAGRANL